ncbi:MAG: hypothetical protein M0017_12885 [Desulfobacteraceae bacterium]|nr:hypothetical protein [Desulfobacteraceae bacterium]
MTCKYLRQYHPGTSRQVISCEARHGLYLPSLAELETFCMAKGHAACPIFHSPFAREEEPVLIGWPGYPFQEPCRAAA